MIIDSPTIYIIRYAYNQIPRASTLLGSDINDTSWICEIPVRLEQSACKRLQYVWYPATHHNRLGEQILPWHRRELSLTIGRVNTFTVTSVLAHTGNRLQRYKEISKQPNFVTQIYSGAHRYRFLRHTDLTDFFCPAERKEIKEIFFRVTQIARISQIF